MFELTPWNRNRRLVQATDPNRAAAADFYNMIDGFFNDNWLGFPSFTRDSFRVDVRENDKAYIVDADLPGFAKEDIRLDFDNNYLTISAVKKEENKTEKENYLHQERRMSSVQRRIYLQDVGSEGVSAKFENGVLEVMLPKRETTGAGTQIPIQ